MVDAMIIEHNNEMLALAVEEIAKYNKQLSVMFANQPFQRCNIAKAFRAGFSARNESTIMVEQAADRDKLLRSMVA